VEELKMMRVEDEDSEELDYSNAPTPDYTVENLVKIITLKNPTIEGVVKPCTNNSLIKLL
jgi:hypothetical protein